MVNTLFNKVLYIKKELFPYKSWIYATSLSPPLGGIPLDEPRRSTRKPCNMIRTITLFRYPYIDIFHHRMKVHATADTTHLEQVHHTKESAYAISYTYLQYTLHWHSTISVSFWTDQSLATGNRLHTIIQSGKESRSVCCIRRHLFLNQDIEHFCQFKMWNKREEIRDFLLFCKCKENVQLMYVPGRAIFNTQEFERKYSSID